MVAPVAPRIIIGITPINEIPCCDAKNPAVGNTATSTSTTTATISNVGATGTATYLAADLDYSKITYIGISDAYVPEGSLTGGSTSTTVTKPSTFENSGITNNNIAADIQYFALTDIF